MGTALFLRATLVVRPDTLERGEGVGGVNRYLSGCRSGHPNGDAFDRGGAQPMDETCSSLDWNIHNGSPRRDVRASSLFRANSGRDPSDWVARDAVFAFVAVARSQGGSLAGFRLRRTVRRLYGCVLQGCCHSSAASQSGLELSAGSNTGAARTRRRSPLGDRAIRPGAFVA